MYFKGNKRQTFGSCCQQDKLKKKRKPLAQKTTKLNISSEARGKIMAADCQQGHKLSWLHIVDIYWYVCSSQLSHLYNWLTDIEEDDYCSIRIHLQELHADPVNKKISGDYDLDTTEEDMTDDEASSKREQCRSTWCVWSHWNRV